MGHIITGLTLRRALVRLPAAAYCNIELYRAVNNIASPPPPWWQEELGATLPRCQSPDNTISLRGWQSRERWTAGGQVAPHSSSGRWLVPFSEIFYSPIAAGDHFRSGIGTIFRIMTDNNPIVHTLKIWFGPPIVNFITMFADPNTRLLTTVDTLLHYQLTNKMISLPAGLTPRRHHSPPDSRG